MLWVQFVLSPKEADGHLVGLFPPPHGRHYLTFRIQTENFTCQFYRWTQTHLLSLLHRLLRTHHHLNEQTNEQQVSLHPLNSESILFITCWLAPVRLWKNDFLLLILSKSVAALIKSESATIMTLWRHSGGRAAPWRWRVYSATPPLVQAVR